MTRHTMGLALVCWFSAASLCAIDLNSVQQEPTPEKRNQLAIECANSALDTARTAYQANDIDKTQASLDEAGEAVSVAYESLKQTGKQARRDPKFFNAQSWQPAKCCGASREWRRQ